MTAIPWSWRGNPDLNQHQSLRTAIAVTLAVIITAGGMSLVGSFVLCVGSDGHADLELALEEVTRLVLSHLTTPRRDGGRLPAEDLAERVATMVVPLIAPDRDPAG